jgi:uncharacterized protein (TIGR03435 family)
VAVLAAATTFEVASVRPSTADTPRYAMRGGPGTTDPERITYTNVMLRAVILAAYDFKNYQLSLPDWFNTLRYDITAKLPAGATKEELQAMLRHLLETRFRMAVHRESRQTPVYALVVGKNGPKIKPIGAEQPAVAELTPDKIATVAKDQGKDGFPVVNMPSPGVIIENRDGRARITVKEVPLSKLADMLSSRAGRPVVDATGLTGSYSFQLYFTPDASPAPSDATSAAAEGPGLFAAVQEQLGLRLEAKTAPLEFLVIDRAEKVPTEN